MTDGEVKSPRRALPLAWEGGSRRMPWRRDAERVKETEAERGGDQFNKMKVVIAYIRSTSATIGQRQSYQWSRRKRMLRVRTRIVTIKMMSNDRWTSTTAFVLHTQVYGLRTVRGSNYVFDNYVDRDQLHQPSVLATHD